MEQIRPSADLRNHYNEIAESCRKNREAVFITKNGREDTVLMSSADYRRMKAELELLDLLSASEEAESEGRVRPAQQAFDEARARIRERFGK